MDDMNKLFPAGPEAVPAAYRLPDLVEQREYLVAGELRNWNGPFQEVLSPIGVQGQPTIIGRYPLQGEKIGRAHV